MDVLLPQWCQNPNQIISRKEEDGRHSGLYNTVETGTAPECQSERPSGYNQLSIVLSR